MGYRRKKEGYRSELKNAASVWTQVPLARPSTALGSSSETEGYFVAST